LNSWRFDLGFWEVNPQRIQRLGTIAICLFYLVIAFFKNSSIRVRKIKNANAFIKREKAERFYIVFCLWKGWPLGQWREKG